MRNECGKASQKHSTRYRRMLPAKKPKKMNIYVTVRCHGEDLNETQQNISAVNNLSKTYAKDHKLERQVQTQFYKQRANTSKEDNGQQTCRTYRKTIKKESVQQLKRWWKTSYRRRSRRHSYNQQQATHVNKVGEIRKESAKAGQWKTK